MSAAPGAGGAARHAEVANAIERIPGWFEPLDVDLFGLLLAESARRGPGDLAELGVYLGRSAALIGAYADAEERFTVVDLFGLAAPDPANRREVEREYPTLGSASFERHYRSVHDRLPQVVHGPTTDILRVAVPGAHRFVHVDASHLYDHVVVDLDLARMLLRPDGVVAVDDFRSEHTPGVAAAAWQALDRGLRPFALSPVKLYATYGDPEPWREVVASSALAGRADVGLEEQRIAGLRVLRLWSDSPAAAPRGRRQAWRTRLGGLAGVPGRLVGGSGRAGR